MERGYKDSKARKTRGDLELMKKGLGFFKHDRQREAMYREEGNLRLGERNRQGFRRRKISPEKKIEFNWIGSEF